MLDHAAPGRYLQGRETKPVAASPTAVPGFVGIAERGPIDVPQAIHGWGEYLEVFGGFVPYGYLAETVFAFFLNGGQKCFVVRAAGEAGDPGDENLAGPCRRVEAFARAAGVDAVVDRNGDETLRVIAIDEGSWGNEIRFAVVRNPSREMELTRLRAPLLAGQSAVQVEDAADIEPGTSVRISAADAPWVKTGYQVAGVRPQDREIDLTSGAVADYPVGSTLDGPGFRLEVRYRNMLEVFDELSVSSDHPRHFTRMINGDDERLGYVERRELGHSILIRVEQVLDPGSGVVRFQPLATPGIDAPAAFRLQGGGDGRRYAQAVFADAMGSESIHLFARRAGIADTQLRVQARPFATTTAVPLPATAGGAMDLVVVATAEGFAIGDPLTLGTGPTAETQDIVARDDRNGLRVQSDFAGARPVGTQASVQDRFDLLVFAEGSRDPVEIHRNLSTDPAATARFFPTVLGAESGLLCAEPPVAPPAGLLAPPVGEQDLVAATDPGDIDHRYYSGYEPDGRGFVPTGGDPARARGAAALEDVGEVSLVAVPDLIRCRDAGGYLQGQKDLLAACARLGDRFALLDAPVGMPASVVLGWPASFSEGAQTRSGALYFPWLVGLFEQALRTVPPCGFVAGAIALSDQLDGVNKAPANLVLKGVVEPVEAVDQTLQASLNPVGVNCVRALEDGRIRLFGARTLSRDGSFRYVNTRRVLQTVVKALYRNLRWAVFEPNGPSLWKRIETSVTGYLAAIVAGGLTASGGPGESYYVRCNAETNAEGVGEEGLVVVQIGLALSAPAEFVVLTARKSPESLSIVEEEN